MLKKIREDQEGSLYYDEDLDISAFEDKSELKTAWKGSEDYKNYTKTLLIRNISDYFLVLNYSNAIPKFKQKSIGLNIKTYWKLKEFQEEIIHDQHKDITLEDTIEFAINAARAKK